MNPKVAVVQMDCKLGNVEHNLATIETLANRANREEPDIVSFPELATTGYSLNRRWRDYAEAIPGPTSDRLAWFANEFGFYLICGMVERDPKSKRIFDSALLVNPSGNIVGVYRKIHLWEKERKFFTPGRGYPVFGTKFGKIGIGVCYDLEFPEPARALALQGAEMIFFSSAQPSPMGNQVDTYIRSRAGENCLFVAHSNRIGREGKTVFFGESQIVSPLCRSLTRKDKGQGFAIARVDFRISHRLRKRKLPYLKQRVPSTYSALTK